MATICKSITETQVFMGNVKPAVSCILTDLNIVSHKMFLIKQCPTFPKKVGTGTKI